jgi:hypothetical protein
MKTAIADDDDDDDDDSFIHSFTHLLTCFIDLDQFFFVTSFCDDVSEED